MRPSDKAWIALGVALVAGVGAWDALCPRGETLSDASRRYTQTHPLLTYGVIGTVVGHLAGWLHPAVDPIHLTGAGIRWITRRFHRRSTRPACTPVRERRRSRPRRWPGSGWPAIWTPLP
ncbi:DUF7427 family protein [Mycobacterium botniense]|uniref:Uncharacterized protein n=1 Tax=Mycobacterium botniense TaxID=84962 RepID=A0A7I9XXX2_9MYCO|nr:hypothetical protein [Mycobacterium botniense]GFG74625.1 hypothetical protein MBOT_19900 [Mycobacterium botniense]